MTDEVTPDVRTEPPKPEPPKPPAPPTPPAPPEPDAVVVPPAVEPSEIEPVEIEAAGVKSPVAAALLSLVPFGVGHLYLGQFARAVAVFAGFWVPILFLGLPLVGIFFYFFGIFDAYRQAQLINLTASDQPLEPSSAFQGGLAAGVFLMVLGGVLIADKWIDLSVVRAFLSDWWPAILVLVGAYFIYGAVKENRQPLEDEFSDEY